MVQVLLGKNKPGRGRAMDDESEVSKLWQRAETTGVSYDVSNMQLRKPMDLIDVNKCQRPPQNLATTESTFHQT